MGELAGQEVSVELMEVDDDNNMTRSVPRVVVLAHNFVSSMCEFNLYCVNAFFPPLLFVL